MWLRTCIALLSVGLVIAASPVAASAAPAGTAAAAAKKKRKKPRPRRLWYAVRVTFDGTQVIKTKPPGTWQEESLTGWTLYTKPFLLKRGPNGDASFSATGRGEITHYGAGAWKPPDDLCPRLTAAWYKTDDVFFDASFAGSTDSGFSFGYGRLPNPGGKDDLETKTDRCDVEGRVDTIVQTWKCCYTSVAGFSEYLGWYPNGMWPSELLRFKISRARFGGKIVLRKSASFGNEFGDVKTYAYSIRFLPCKRVDDGELYC